MWTRNRSSLTIAVVTVVALLGIGWIVGSGHVQAIGDDYYENLNLLNQITTQIRMKYVDEINAKHAINSAIRGMLDTLDPYTEFLEKKENDEMKMMQIQGKYGGLGIKIAKQDKSLIVVSLFEDTPAYNAGIQTGDRIVKIEGRTTADFDVTQAADLLRGEPGTAVSLAVERDGVDAPIDYRIVRAIITIPVIQYAGVIQDDIGYLKLNQFTEDSGAEVDRALRRLQTTRVSGLILDLRHNPGGLLEQAVTVASKFLESGRLIVYTKGRDKDQDKEYRASGSAGVRDLPLVVLVDEYSASASEIVAGAIQDWDRGVVIGTTTYGKALVQQIFPMSNGTALKITTARYYTPSGRLIQKMTRTARDGEDSTAVHAPAEPSTAPPAKKEQFRTHAGRFVYGGGGVTPDVEVKSPASPRLVNELTNHQMFINFATHYTAAHKDFDRATFRVDDAMIAAFKTFLAERRFTYKTDAELELEKLEGMAKERKFDAAVLRTITVLRDQLQAQRDAEFEANRDLIEGKIGAEVTAKLWGSEGRYTYALQHDPQVLAGVDMLKDPQKYKQSLSAQKPETKRTGALPSRTREAVVGVE
ncbi:MAG: S41 family peptidase [Candidatus Latescibacteria bacterium]|nr:S41 family peptidase [Candidatus Latescibacterota bacterium]